MRAFVVVVVCSLMVVPLAQAAPVVVRYLGGAHVPGLVHGACWGGDNLEATPGVGGACVVRIDAGTRLVTVRDDVLGPRSFFWLLSPIGVATRCTEGFGSGSTTISVTAACPELSVYVQAGSTTGTVRID